MTSIGNNTNNTNNSGGGNSTHRKLKGTAEVVHGIGENIRGRVMNALDSSGGGGHPEAEQGSREVEHGMAKLTGGPGIDGVAHRGTGTGTSAANHAAGGGGGIGGGGTSTTAAPLAHEGNSNAALLVSTGTAGFNAGPAAEGGFQPQNRNASSGAGPPLQGGSNDRDFYPGDSTDMPHEPSEIPQEGATTGPAPDRSTLAGSPQRLG